MRCMPPQYSGSAGNGLKVYRYGVSMDFEEELLALLDAAFPTPEPGRRWFGGRCWLSRHSWVTLSLPTSDGERFYKAVCSRCAARRYGSGLG